MDPGEGHRKSVPMALHLDHAWPPPPFTLLQCRLPGLGTPSWGIYIYLHVLTPMTNMLWRKFFWKLRDFVEFYFILVIASKAPLDFLDFNFFGRNSWWQNTGAQIVGRTCWEREGTSLSGWNKRVSPATAWRIHGGWGRPREELGDGQEVTEEPTEELLAPRRWEPIVKSRKCELVGRDRKKNVLTTRKGFNLN